VKQQSLKAKPRTEGDGMKFFQKEDESPKILFKLEEVAQMLSVSKSHLYSLIATRRLPTIKLGRVRRVSIIALQQWIEEQSRCEEEIHSITAKKTQVTVTHSYEEGQEGGNLRPQQNGSVC
jgi:excisionase family DNA binding protein